MRELDERFINRSPVPVAEFARIRVWLARILANSATGTGGGLAKRSSSENRDISSTRFGSSVYTCVLRNRLGNGLDTVTYYPNLASHCHDRFSSGFYLVDTGSIVSDAGKELSRLW